MHNASVSMSVNEFAIEVTNRLSVDEFGSELPSCLSVRRRIRQCVDQLSVRRRIRQRVAQLSVHRQSRRRVSIVCPSTAESGFVWESTWLNLSPAIILTRLSAACIMASSERARGERRWMEGSA